MTDSTQTYHVPVLLQESIGGLAIHEGGVYVDVTFGGGGHSREILRQLHGTGHLYSFDQDADAEANIGTEAEDNFTFVRSNFRYLKNWMRYYGVDHIDGLLADLGVSSHHFDDEERGFSFRFDAPLDMRMNKRDGLTAADLLRDYSEEQLADVLYLYGEFRQSRRMAAAIVKARQQKSITTTIELANVVAPLLNKSREKKEMARLFQALRIEVNHELEHLKECIDKSFDCLHHHLPLAGRPTRQERDAKRQRRGKGRQGLLWQGRNTLPTGQQQGDRADGGGAGAQPAQP